MIKTVESNYQMGAPGSFPAAIDAACFVQDLPTSFQTKASHCDFHRGHKIEFPLRTPVFAARQRAQLANTTTKLPFTHPRWTVPFAVSGIPMRLQESGRRNEGRDYFARLGRLCQAEAVRYFPALQDSDADSDSDGEVDGQGAHSDTDSDHRALEVDGWEVREKIKRRRVHWGRKREATWSPISRSKTSKDIVSSFLSPKLEKRLLVVWWRRLGRRFRLHDLPQLDTNTGKLSGPLLLLRPVTLRLSIVISTQTGCSKPLLANVVMGGAPE